MEKSVRAREVEAKIASLRIIIDQDRLAGVLITQKYNLSWLTAGAGNQVLYDMQNSLIGVLVTPGRAIVIAENGDLDRLIDEEFAHCPFEYQRIWWCSGGIGAAAAAHAKGPVGVDAPVGGIADPVEIDGRVAEYRQVLLPGEADRLRNYGREAACIITDVVRRAEPGVRECDLAAELSREFLRWGFAVAVILIGGDERSLKYRHQVVTEKKIRRHFSFCGVGKKGGLTFPINRVVSFGPAPAELADANRRIETVFVHLNSLARVGATLGSIYARLPEVFAAAGLDREEWMRHSIGGTMGYHPREQVVSEGANYALRAGNVIGWNPSLPGVMAEDVYFLGDAGLEFVTWDPRWPRQVLEANGLSQIRPAILEL
jgi:Xaa-Pro aminopeptidase